MIVRNSFKNLISKLLEIRKNCIDFKCNKTTHAIEPIFEERKLRKESNNEEVKQFMKVFPVIINDFIEEIKNKNIPNVEDCFKNVLIQNVQNGSKNRALSFLHVYKKMENPQNLTSEKVFLAHILGWCIELIQASCIIIDDVIDSSKLRRGSKAWYQKDNVGLRAIIDAILIENHVYLILKKNFSHLPIYIPIIQLIQENIRKLCYGEILDAILLKRNAPNMNKFNKNYYKSLVRFKTTPSVIELPYNLARCLSNKFEPLILRRTEEILIRLGEFYQIQNDFLDCYNISNFKTGNDIEEGKCTWLIVTALEKGTLEERKLLQIHYGRKHPQSVGIVKELYENINIPREYAKCEKEFFHFINRNIKEVSMISNYENLFKSLGYLYDKYI